MTIYQEKGYDTRLDYLKSLAKDYGLDLPDILALAEILGPLEDFDGLVTAIQDYSGEQE